MASSDDVVRFIYRHLRWSLRPDELETFIETALSARGSKSVHGFALLLADLHELERHI